MGEGPRAPQEQQSYLFLVLLGQLLHLLVDDFRSLPCEWGWLVKSSSSPNVRRRRCGTARRHCACRSPLPLHTHALRAQWRNITAVGTCALQRPRPPECGLVVKARRRIEGEVAVGLVWQSAQEGLPQLLGGNRFGREGKTANSSPNKVLTWPRCVWPLHILEFLCKCIATRLYQHGRRGHLITPTCADTCTSQTEARLVQRWIEQACPLRKRALEGQSLPVHGSCACRVVHARVTVPRLALCWLSE